MIMRWVLVGEWMNGVMQVGEEDDDVSKCGVSEWMSGSEW